MLSTASTVEEICSGELLLNEDNLHRYQHFMIDWIMTHPFCALFVDMGLGKTISVLTALIKLFSRFEIGTVLIIAPLNVCRNTWPTELKNWSHVKELGSEVVPLFDLHPAKRGAAAIKSGNIHIINRELVVWLVHFWGKDWPYDTVVIDESSSFKKNTSKRFRAVRKIRGKISRIIELTGTPTSNGLLDLWSQIFLLDGGERLGKTITKYRDTYFEADYMGYNYTPKDGAKEEIYEKLSDICLSLSAEDYLKMPGKIFNNIKASLPAALRNYYKELEREFILMLEDEAFVAQTAAVLSGKLLQFCNGALYLEDSKEFQHLHDLKIDMLENVIEESAGENVLVAYKFKSDLVRLKKRFPNAAVLDKNPNTVERWNKGEIEILLAHPASAGHGLNLQHGGHIIVWFGVDWSLELYQQFNARLHRQGQTKPVIIHQLLIEDSIDGNVLDSLAGKYETQSDLLNALKKRVGA